MQQAFVTGGSGFVGGHLLAALAQKGVGVRALARSESAAHKVQAAGAQVVRGDLEDGAALREGMQGCDVVFHAAAHVSDWGDPESFHRINVAGTEQVLAAARAAGVRRVIHVSSEAVLAGERPIIQAVEGWPYPKHPVGLYPLTKGLAETRVLAANSAEMATIIVRPRLIWGPGDTTILPGLIKGVRGGTFAWIDGGYYLTSTCHVTNVCEGLLLAATQGRGGEIYFVTDGPPIEFRAFATALLATQGLTPGAMSIPRWLARTLANGVAWGWRTFRLSGTPPITPTMVRLIGEEVTVNDAKARRELGYQGLVSREAGLAALPRLAA